MADGLIFVGCGNMGSALASGYAARVPTARLLVVEPQVEKARALLPASGRVEVLAEIASLGDAEAAATVLAVKPQSMASVLPLLAPLRAACGLVVSIAAGVGVDVIRAVLPRARVVRAMPNTPATLGAGVTGLWGSTAVTAEDRAVCDTIFGAVGTVHWLESEAQVDAVTAVSGSGPAYVFAVAEAMAAAGVRLGLQPALAGALARGTIAGAAAMLRRPGADPAQLKAAVRSPAGTTDAALRVFEASDALDTLFADALQAAHRRAAELGHGG